jgi:hypothetical protein
MTPLAKTLKRALRIDGRDYVVTLGPDALKITEKGHRLGLELQWADLISGESALAMALQASVGNLQSDSPPAVAHSSPKARSTLKPNAASKRRPAPKRPPGTPRRSQRDKRTR